MRVRCEQCGAQYNVDDSRIPEQGVSITCPKCSNSFIVKPEAVAAPAVPPTAPLPGAVPLPGASAPAAPLPGAVPLPGAAAAPLPGAVPLPGAAGSTDLFADSSPAPRSSNMGDLFGDMGASPDNQDSVAPHPFHGDSVLEKSSGGGLSDFIDQQAPAAPTANAVVTYKIRKTTGRVFGPYDEGSILQMLRAHELAGDEEASVDGDNWIPLAKISVFGEEIQGMMAASLGALGDLPGLPHADLPGLANADLPGLANADLPGIPNADLPGIPNADLPGIPDIGLPGLAGAELPVSPGADLPGLAGGGAKSSAVMWNPDEHSAAAVHDFMGDIGLSAATNGQNPDAAIDPLDPLAADLSSKAFEQRAQKRRAQRRSAAKAKAGPIVKIAVLVGSVLLIFVGVGIFLGIATPDKYGWFAYKWLDRTYLNPAQQIEPKKEIVEVPYDASKVHAFIEQGTYQAYASALPYLTGDASSNPKAAADLAYIYAKMALVHHDLKKITLGKLALSKASGLEDNQKLRFARASFDILEKSCARAAKMLQTHTGLVAPEKPDAEQSELYVLMGLSQTCIKKPDMDAAQRFVDAALIINPDDGFALLEQAGLSSARKDELTAQGYLQKLLASQPDNALAHVLLGIRIFVFRAKPMRPLQTMRWALNLALMFWHLGRWDGRRWVWRAFAALGTTLMRLHKLRPKRWIQRVRTCLRLKRSACLRWVCLIMIWRKKCIEKF